MQKSTKLIACLSLFAANHALAQQDTGKVKALDEVIITGQYKPQSVKNSVYQVKVITKDRIQKQGATKLQDVLNSELNFRFTQDPSLGGSNINLLGLKGQNVKILLDGLPIVGRQGINNEVNINQIDVNSIERIEIVEGPMSVVYGADALAGVINIITKKAAPSKFSVSARLQEETVGKEYGTIQGIHTQNINASFRKNRWEIGGGFGYNYFGGWKGDSTNRELTWNWKDQIIGNGYIGYTTSRFNIRYRIDGLDEIVTNPANYIQQQRGSNDMFAPDQEYLNQRTMHQLQAAYFVNSNLSFQAQASFTNFTNQTFSTLVSRDIGDVKLNPAPGVQNISKFTGFTFRTMAQYKISSVFSVQPGVDINLESGEAQRLQPGTNRVEDYAFFITSEITPTPKINIRPGLRFISNSVFDAPPVIPSLNTKFVLTKNLDLRVAYERGFRSPSIRELYFNFFDANHQIVGNPDLKPETSNSFTGSLTWRPSTIKKDMRLTAILSGFYNNVTNQINYALNNNVFIYANIEKYKTRGVNASGTLNYKNWNASLGFGYIGRYNEFVETDKSLPDFKWAAEINSTIGYSFSRIGLNANLFYKFTGKLPYYQLDNTTQQPILAQTDSYNWADFTLNKTFFKRFAINAGIKNIFDVDNVKSTATDGAHGTSGVNSVGYGRSYFTGIVFNWEKK
jgi:outer membrane receptor for ferrienterochelin and colicins